MPEQIGIMSRPIKWLDGITYTNQGRNLKTGYFFEDFIVDRPFNSDVSSPLLTYWTGAGAMAVHLAGIADRPGVLGLHTGTTNAGLTSLLSTYTFANGSILLGAAEYTIEEDIYIPTLSDAVEEYAIRLGFLDAFGLGVDGVYFRYDRALVGNNWYAMTSSNSVRTAVDTGIAVAAAAWIRLKIVINHTGTSARFYINNILVATIITNIPVGAGRSTCLDFHIQKSVGITSRVFYIDWMWFHYDLIVSR